jgi:hypothetical protein
MTAAEKSIVGLAKQVAKGTPNTTDADFTYLLFTGGGLGVSPLTLPLDPEVGGGAILRDVVKAGVMSGGQLAFIPRPASLGMAFMGMTGKVYSVDGSDGSYKHTFSFDPADHFAAPYYTGRAAPGNMWGEQFQDMRFTTLQLAWRGGRFVTGAMGLVGGLPSKVSTAAWDALSQVDSGPQFLAPLGHIEVPAATKLSVLSGSFVASSSIPMDEQWVVGSYSPEGFDITQRAFMLQLVVKVPDGTLFNKIMYDPAGGSAWVANIFKEADIKLDFASTQLAAPAKPYSFAIKANGNNAASGKANIAWSAQPVQMVAGRNILMNVVGTFLADPDGGSPIEIELVNQVETY